MYVTYITSVSAHVSNLPWYSYLPTYPEVPILKSTFDIFSPVKLSIRAGKLNAVLCTMIMKCASYLNSITSSQYFLCRLHNKKPKRHMNKLTGISAYLSLLQIRELPVPRNIEAGHSETSANFYQTTRRHIPEDIILHSRHHKNLKIHSLIRSSSHPGRLNIFTIPVTLFL